LNSIRIIYQAIIEHSRGKRPRGNRIGDEFKLFVNRVFKEEGLVYIMAEDGTVQFHPDEEFETNRALTLNYLAEQRFDTASKSFNHVYDHFHADPPRFKSALKDIFDANEYIFKQITSAPRLSAHYIEQNKSLLNKGTDTTSNKAITN